MNNDSKNNKIKSFSNLIENNLDRFLDELSALNDSLPIQLILLSVKHNELLKDLELYSEKTEEKDDDDEEVFVFKSDFSKFKEFQKTFKQLNQTDLALKIIPRNYVVSIISQYDAFVGELVRTIYQINPHLIRSSEKPIDIEDLFNYKSIEEIKHVIIDKEVDTLLREEHFEQFKLLERKISKVFKKEFTLTTNLSVLPKFVELTQRRNLFVHTNGFTTRQYSEAKKKWKFESECSGELNIELKANSKYCNYAYEILFEISVKLTHVLWRKFIPDDRKEADDNLNNIIYELLQDNHYRLAIILADFATNDIKKFSSEQIRKFIIINKAIAYKMLEKEDKCMDIIKKEDWSIGNEFKLAKLVLEEEYLKAKELMIRIGNNDELITKDVYKSWPLFKKFRETDFFKSGFEIVFKEEFSIKEVKGKHFLDSIKFEETDEIINK